MGPNVIRLYRGVVALTMAVIDTPQAPRDPGGIDADHVLDSIVGPFYTPASMAEVLGVSVAEAMRQLEAGDVLGAQLEDGTWVCPTWQLTNSQVRLEFVALWGALVNSADAWTALLWICAPHPDLDRRSPRQWIENEQPAEVIEMLAAYIASRWAQ